MKLLARDFLDLRKYIYIPIVLTFNCKKIKDYVGFLVGQLGEDCYR